MLRSAVFGLAAVIAAAGWSASAAPAVATRAAAAAPCAAENHARIGRELQSLLDKLTAAEGAPHAALLRVQCGGQVWSLASGIADVSSGRAAKPSDRFRAGSILKPAVSAVVLQLAEEGKLSLDDPITRRLPARHTAGFKDADAITVRMLLNHRSGIGEFLDDKTLVPAVLENPRRVWAPEELIAAGVGVGPKFRPGEAYAYNNTEFVLLGLIIEEATGRSWRENVVARIFRPLGIPAETLPPPGAALDLSGHMHGYMKADGRELDMSIMDPSMADAAGGHAFAPTTSELARMLDAILAGRYFERPATLADMQAFLPAGDTTSAGPRRGYGLGLAEYDFPGGTAIGHTGGTAGYSSLVLQFPDLGVTMSAAISAEDGALTAKLAQEARQVIIGARR